MSLSGSTKLQLESFIQFFFPFTPSLTFCCFNICLKESKRWTVILESKIFCIFQSLQKICYVRTCPRKKLKLIYIYLNRQSFSFSLTFLIPWERLDIADVFQQWLFIFYFNYFFFDKKTFYGCFAQMTTCYIKICFSHEIRKYIIFIRVLKTTIWLIIEKAALALSQTDNI
jgi:hypothetical protein